MGFPKTRITHWIIHAKLMEDKQNNLNTIIGMGLIFLLVFLWMQYAAPPKPEQSAEQKPPTTEKQAAPATTTSPAAPAAAPALPDSAQQLAQAARFGAFAPAAQGTEKTVTLENELVRVTFTNKGGRIKEVFLKKYNKINTDSTGRDVTSPVRLLEDAKNRFEYLIPAANTTNGVSSADLYFESTQTDNQVVFRAPTSTGGYLEQRYTLLAGNYQIDYRLGGEGLQSALAPGQNTLRLTWVNHLDKLERNQEYERSMSTVYYKPNDDDPDYCDCQGNDSDDLGELPVKWISHSNQFFNTSIIAKNFSFRNFVGQTEMRSDAEADLKTLRSTATVPLDNGPAEMTIYTPLRCQGLFRRRIPACARRPR